MSFRFIVDGLIGVGKSTLISNVTPFNIKKISEPLKKFTLLQSFYGDIKEYAYPFQKQIIQVLTEEYSNHDNQHLIIERSINTSINVFSMMLHKQGYISNEQFDDLRQYEEKNENDVYIFLKINPEEAYNRIKARGRQEEKDITLEYLHQLNYQYGIYIKQLIDRNLNVFIIDSTDINVMIKQFYRIIDIFLR